MGFFTDIFGGGASSSTQNSSSTNSSQSGLSLLTPDILEAINGFARQFSNVAPGAAESYKPLGTTGDENRAFGMIRGGFAPTESSIGSDIAMQTNPFDEYVINGINREAQGNNSILKSTLNKYGGFGSNQQLIGANDIDLTRLEQIGRFKQGQYDTALNNALTTLPGARSQDAQNLLGIGGFERSQDAATKQAPMQALMALAQALGVLPQSGGSTSTGTSSSTGYSSSNNTPGIAGFIGGLIPGGGKK